jgi:4-amino-4-deoxy-L-arabinose transferase-like glycosyltransferase
VNEPRAGAHHPAGIIAVIVLAAFVLNLIYSIAIPPWMGPDEPRHVEYVLLLVEKGRLVVWGDSLPAIEQKIIRSMDQHDFWRFGIVSPEVFKPGTLPSGFDQVWSPGLTHELHQPPLYYLLQAPVAWLSGGMDVATQAAWMRVVSALLGALTVPLTWLTVREVFPDNQVLAIAAACFVAFLPMNAFVAGIVNNDVLAEVLGALLIFLLVRGQRRGFSLPLFVCSALVLVLGLLAKRTVVFAVPLLVLALVLPLRGKVHLLSWRVAAAGMALISAALWAGTRVLDALAKQSAQLPAVLRSLVYIYVLFVVRPSAEHAYSARWQDFVTIDACRYYGRWLQRLFATFWASFGWANVHLDRWYYVALGVVSLIAMLGAGLVIWDAACAKTPALHYQQNALLLMGAAVVFAVTVLVVKMVREWYTVPRVTTQARFLFPALVPIAILFVAGLLRLLPQRYHVLFVRGVVVALLLLNLVSLLGYIRPFYHLL